MVTTSWTIVCVDVVKKWWEMTSNLESDLRELRSLHMTTSSLSEDSRSIRYESNQALTITTSNIVTHSACNSAAAKTFTFNTDRSRNTCLKEVYPKDVSKKAAHYRRRAHRTTFKYEAPELYPRFKQGVYKALKASIGLYDMLGLVHLVPAPWDHAFRPPYYPPVPASTVLQFGVIEIE